MSSRSVAARDHRRHPAPRGELGRGLLAQDEDQDLVRLESHQDRLPARVAAQGIGPDQGQRPLLGHPGDEDLLRQRRGPAPSSAWPRGGRPSRAASGPSGPGRSAGSRRTPPRWPAFPAISVLQWWALTNGSTSNGATCDLKNSKGRRFFLSSAFFLIASGSVRIRSRSSSWVVSCARAGSAANSTSPATSTANRHLERQPGELFTAERPPPRHRPRARAGPTGILDVASSSGA